MYFILRAIEYIKKQKAKTILLFVLFFIIANIAMAGLSVYRASEVAKQNIRTEIGANVVYSIDSVKLTTDVKSGLIEYETDASTLAGVPLLKNVQLLVNLDYVKSVDMILHLEVVNELLEQYIYIPTTTQTGQGKVNPTVETGDFSLKTYSSLIPTDFSNNNATLVEGRYASETEISSASNVILVEKTFADNNQLKLGDTVELTEFNATDSSPISFTIIGIYKSNVVLDDRIARTMSPALLPQNQFFIHFDAIENIMSTPVSDDMLLAGAVFELEDPTYISAFKVFAAEKIDLKYGLLDANDALYIQLSGPIDSLGNLSGMMVIIVMIAGALILGLITALTVNQRKYEIGMLLAIGESKLKIISQFIVEVAVIAVIAFGLSVFTGIQAGKMISESVSMQPSTAVVSTTGTQSGRGSSSKYTQPVMTNPSMNIDDVEINIELDGMSILLLLGSGLLISIVSVIIPALYVTRYNPKQILNNIG
jgi:putative ABC transport system permease protein